MTKTISFVLRLTDLLVVFSGGKIKVERLVETYLQCMKLQKCSKYYPLVNRLGSSIRHVGVEPTLPVYKTGFLTVGRMALITFILRSNTVRLSA